MLRKIEIAKKILTDVDNILDLRKVYDELKSVETSLSKEQKDFLHFLKTNEKSFT